MKSFDILLFKNKLHALFENSDWKIQKNNSNIMYYSKLYDETNYIEIRILKQSIIVSVPIKNSLYQYSTTFDIMDNNNIIPFIQKHVNHL